MSGSVAGVVGLGEIGREVAERCAAFGMAVLYHQRSRLRPAEEAALNATWCPLPELAARADVISLHLPLDDRTRGIVGRAVLECVKPGALLVNTARAALVDRAALMAALDGGRLGGLGLDTGYDEPARPDDPLLDRPNVILTPHTAPAGRRNGLDDMADLCRTLHRHVVGTPVGAGAG